MAGCSPRRAGRTLVQALQAAVARLDKSLNPNDTLQKLRNHQFTWSDSIHVFHLALVGFWFTIMQVPGFPLKLLIPVVWVIGLLVPLTSQFLFPFTPIAVYLLSFYTSRFIPTSWRPDISVSLLPTLESVLYGANISDILTRFTHPILDIIAWIPYGVGHFTFPFFVGAFLWLFRTNEALVFFSRAFGYLNLLGVWIQILLPCAAPWYELIHGLTPANYGMKGSPGGLARIDHLFHSNGYTTAFTNSPIVFGAFPSLHSACATMEAFFISHFFPQYSRYAWTYAGVLYWATMYLTHHYLIDVVGGACLSTAFFYFFMPDELKGSAGATAGPAGLTSRTKRNKYEVYDLEVPRNNRGLADAADFDLAEESDHESDEEEVDITYRSPKPDHEVPSSAAPFVRSTPGVGNKGKGAPRGHRHTASIASLIRGDERTEEGWSPRPGAGFVIPGSPLRGD
ncbi:hypothetical protein ONZ45_g13750 [Pleurotus djamor]|nr:hypothetical protein ONZ45_g13750 [Pleurotus djamor]